MQTSMNEILHAALRLPETDRLLIATRLIETLPEDVLAAADEDAELVEELQRRALDMDPGIPAAHLWKQDDL